MTHSTEQSVLAMRCYAVLIALASDVLLGSPPESWHPMVLFGRWMHLGERFAPPGPAARLGWGMVWLGAGAAVTGSMVRLVPRHTLVQGLAASTLLTYRGLDHAVEVVQTALESGDIDEARRELSTRLVSRPTGDLDAAEVAAAAIESLAENLSDSVIAPALAYLLGGLPGIAIYRLVNTADAMWGYRNERYEYLGKAAARTDDLFNLVPARLTAVLIALATALVNQRGAIAWKVAWRDAARTASPNAGWPMATIAGALDTRLTRRDHYTLGDGSRVPDTTMIREARVIVRVAVILVAIACAMAGLTDLLRHGSESAIPA